MEDSKCFPQFNFTANPDQEDTTEGVVVLFEIMSVS